MASGFIQSVSKGVHSKCPNGAKPMEQTSQVFSYEKHFNRLKLGQIVNIIDESQFNGWSNRRKNHRDSGFLSEDISVGSGVQVRMIT